MIYIVILKPKYGLIEAEYIGYTTNGALAKEFVSQIVNKRSVISIGEVYTSSLPDHKKDTILSRGAEVLSVYKSETDPDCSVIATPTMYYDFRRNAVRYLFNGRGNKMAYSRPWFRKSKSIEPMVVALEAVRSTTVENLIKCQVNEDYSGGVRFDYVKLSTCVDYVESALCEAMYPGFEFSWFASNSVYGASGNTVI